MVEMYTGTPGSGKSLHVAERIYRRMMKGYTVIANFEINLDVFPPKKKRLGKFVFIDNMDLSPDGLMQYSLEHIPRDKFGRVKEGELLLVIDECQLLFNTRDWNVKTRMKWCTFFSQHRKFSYDIILVTQFDRMIDRQIRAMVEYEVKHRKIGNFGAAGFIISWITRILSFGQNYGLFIAIKFWYGVHARLGKEFFQAKPRYMQMYNSYKVFASAQDGGAQAGDPPKPGQTPVTDEPPTEAAPLPDEPPEEVGSGGEAP